MTAAPGYRWVVLAIGVGAQAAGGAFIQGLPSVTPAMRAGYGLSLAEVGVALGAVLWGMTAALLVWGMLADRFGERRVIVIGALGAAAALTLAATTSSLLGLSACLAMAGVMVASVNVASGRSLMGWFGPRERGTVLGIRQASLPIGGAAAAALLPLIALRDRPERAMLGLAAALVVAAGVAALWMREPARTEASDQASGTSPLRDRRIWTLAAASGLLSSVQFAFMGFLVLYLHEERGVDARLAAAALVALQLGGALARILVGRWSDRRSIRLELLRGLASAETVALAATAGLAAGQAPGWLVIAAVMVTGTLAMCWNGLAYTAAAELASPGRSGTALGIETTALALGGAVSLPLFGLIVAGADWPAAFALLAAVSLAAWWMFRGLDLGERRGTARYGADHSWP